MQNETQTSPELQHQAVQIQLPADLLTQLEEVKAQAEILTGGNENWLDEQINGGYDTYGHDMSEFTGDLDTLEKSGLEPFNFRVDSSGWERITESHSEYLISPDKNVKQIISGWDESLVGEQLFTPEGYLKYTTQYGKKIPSEWEWENIVKIMESKNGELEKILGTLCIGIRYFSSTQRLNSNVQRHNGVGWSGLREQACLYMGIPGQKIDPAPIIIGNNTFNFIRCFKK